MSLQFVATRVFIDLGLYVKVDTSVLVLIIERPDRASCVGGGGGEGDAFGTEKPRKAG